MKRITAFIPVTCYMPRARKGETFTCNTIDLKFKLFQA